MNLEQPVGDVDAEIRIDSDQFEDLGRGNQRLAIMELGKALKAARSSYVIPS